MKAKLRVRIVPSTLPRYASADDAVKAAVPALAALVRALQSAQPIGNEKAA
jgi:hypothetical protein